MGPKPLIIDIDEAIRLYKRGESFEQISRKLGVSSGTIRRRILGAGVQVRLPAPLKPIDLEEVVRLYEAGGLNFRDLASQAGVSEKTLRRRLVSADVALRTKEESARLTAWRRYPEEMLLPWIERYVAGEPLQKLVRLSGINRRRLEMAIIRAGYGLRTLRQSVGLRYTRLSVSERQRLVAHAHIAKRGSKASEISVHRRAQTYERTLQLASRADLLLCMWLAQRGVNFTPQKAVGPYNLDIAIEELFIAVEVNGSWHYFADRASTDSQRREYLFDRGWRLIEVALTALNGRAWKYLRPSCADSVVSLLQSVSSYETSFGQYCVIGGDGELLTGSSSKNSNRTVIPTAVDTLNMISSNSNAFR